MASPYAVALQPVLMARHPVQATAGHPPTAMTGRRRLPSTVGPLATAMTATRAGQATAAALIGLTTVAIDTNANRRGSPHRCRQSRGAMTTEPRSEGSTVTKHKAPSKGMPQPCRHRGMLTTTCGATSASRTASANETATATEGASEEVIAIATPTTEAVTEEATEAASVAATATTEAATEEAHVATTATTEGLATEGMLTSGVDLTEVSGMAEETGMTGSVTSR